ncbi:MAG TPA: hypothetical protein VMR97_06580 [Acidimicrobiales bacterium]|nr:hypothetical protein [Acidimicrobiales bacterium]
MATEAAARPTFTYRGQRYLWGYSSDRTVCGLWRVEDREGDAERTWPISEHQEAWKEFRSLEPTATAYTETATAVGGAEPVSSEGVRATAPVAAVSKSDQDAVAERSFPDPVGAGGGPEPGSGPETDGGPAPRTRWRRLGLIAAVCALIALGAVLGVRSIGSNSPSTGTTDPAQLVLTAATTTEGLHTAHLSMTETITGVKGAGTITVPATGEVDFGSQDASITMTVAGVPVSVISSQGSVFVSIPQVSQLLPGKSWVSVPISSEGSASQGALSGGDPSQMLQILASHGNTVTSIGPSVIGGVDVQGYSVLVDKTAAEAELSGSGLPASVVQAGEQFLQAVGPITFKVYVASDNQLSQMDFATSVPGVPGASVSVQLTFSDFGAPVSISPPPASEVATLQQFLSAAR